MSQESLSTASSNGPLNVREEEPLGMESGLDALRESGDFGAVEPLDGRDAGDHLALLYESTEEQFAAVVPFMIQGLEDGERCMYVVDELSRAALLDRMRDRGVDVDAYLESGALSFHTVGETYLRDGEFDPDEMFEFYAEMIEDVTDEYAGLRISAETSWLQDDATTIRKFMAYESKVNRLFEGEDCIAMCQYDRGAFSADVLCDIVRTHPHLVFDGTVCHNFYYTPPKEFFGPERPAREVDRMLGTLRGRTRAKTTLRRRERGLTALTEATRTLMAADADEVEDHAVETARDVLDVPFAAVWRYDDERGRFVEPTVSAPLSPGEALDPLRELAWAAFVDGSRTVREDADALSGTGLRHCIALPLSTHGAMVVATDRARPFDDGDVDLAATIESNVRAAFDRAEREALLRDRERALGDRTERLERVNRVNAVIREIESAIVDAASREDIERAVCESLAAADPYRFAWIGAHDAVDGAVESRTAAAVHDVDADALLRDAAAADASPAERAIDSGDPAVVQDVLTDDRVADWRADAVDAGLYSLCTVPLSYEGADYGALTVYAGEPNAFDDLERSVLRELGELIGHAINAVQSRHALVSDSAVEVELEVADRRVRPMRLAQELDCTVEFDGLVPQADDASLFFFTVEGAGADDVLEFVGDCDDVIDVGLLTEQGDRCSFECRITAPTVLTPVVDSGAAPKRVTADGDTVRITAELPRHADVRETVDRVRRTYPDAELVGRREYNRPVETPSTFRTTLDERLTDRQREILRAAYFAGFFEEPRKRSGKDVAASLGISQPTFNSHMRTAQRRLFTLLFDETERRPLH